MSNALVRRTLALAATIAFLLVRAEAQLLPPNELGMSMGHILLNVSDVAAHTTFWTRQFDARPVTVGQLQGVRVQASRCCSAPRSPPVPTKGQQSITWA